METPGESLLILTPCFNDWAALRLLLPEVDRAMTGSKWCASVLIVDDASTEPIPDHWPGESFGSIESVTVLHLRCNLGHQRALALGLYHAHEFIDAAAVLVMDGDGEDRAEDLPKLLEEFERGGRRGAVFAARTRRMESLAFQFFYRAFRVVHRVLTGIEVRVGNFSVLPRSAVVRLMGSSDLWNHYAAAVDRGRLPRRLLPLARGKRLEGKSRMNFVSLLIHGLAAMSVFSDTISARLLAASAVFAVLGAGSIVWTGMGVTAGILLALAAQSLTFAALFALAIVSRRSSANFLLLRDAPYFILDSTPCWNRSSLARLGATLSLDEQTPAREEQPDARAKA
jgi:hypothetical protein